MKKYLMALAMLLTLSALPAEAQKHRHNPAITVSLSGDEDEVVAFSDTTSADTDSVVVNSGASTTTYSTTLTPSDEFLQKLDWLMDIMGGTFGGFVAVVAMILVFLLLASPFVFVIIVVWLLLRNRNRKYRLAEKAVESGQQIPQELLRTEQQTNDYLWRRGIRNAAVGLGLVVFFYCLGADPLTGIGWLVACYGVGQAIIAKTSRGGGEN